MFLLKKLERGANNQGNVTELSLNCSHAAGQGRGHGAGLRPPPEEGLQCCPRPGLWELGLGGPTVPRDRSGCWLPCSGTYLSPDAFNKVQMILLVTGLEKQGVWVSLRGRVPKKKKKEGGRTADSYSRARIQGLTALPTFVDGSRRWVVTRRARSQEAEHRQGPPFKSVFVGLKMKTWATQEGKAEPGMWPGHRLGSPPSPGKPREGPPGYTAPGTCAGPKARRRWKVLGHPPQTLPLQTQKPRLTQGPGLAQGPWEEPRAGIPYSRTFPSNTRLPGKATLVLHQKTDSQRTGI